MEVVVFLFEESVKNKVTGIFRRKMFAGLSDSQKVT
jgi:hypothetical protein